MENKFKNVGFLPSIKNSIKNRNETDGEMHQKKINFLDSNPMIGISAYSALTVVGLGIGSTIGTYVFFGSATLLGLIAIVETNSGIKRLVKSGNRVIDILIFGSSLYATAVLGVTISASLVFAGLGYSLVYAPLLRTTL